VPIKVYRRGGPKLVADEMEICVFQGYEEIHFYEDLFNIIPIDI